MARGGWFPGRGRRSRRRGLALPSGGRAAAISVAQRGGFLRVRRRVLAQSPPAVAPGPALRLPARTFAPGVYLCELPATNGQTAIGTLLDEKTGTAAALLRARGGPFCLLDEKDKEHQLAAWAGVLESVSAQRSSLARLQWCQRALPADSEPLLAHLRSTGDVASPGFGGHALLLERAGKRSWRHETFLVVSVRCRGRHGHRGPTAEGAETLRNQVRAIRSQMRSAGFVCEGVLDAAGAATAIGGFLVAGLDQNPGAFPWPLAVEEHWSEVRAEGCWHRTFWVAEWPRSRIGPDFLSPLLVGTARRSVSVVMAPIPPERAARDAESSRTAEVADAELRAQGGFLQTARQRRQSEALEGRETELADGRGRVRVGRLYNGFGVRQTWPGRSGVRTRAGGRGGQAQPAPPLRAAKGSLGVGAAFRPRHLTTHFERRSHPDGTVTWRPDLRGQWAGAGHSGRGFGFSGPFRARIALSVYFWPVSTKKRAEIGKTRRKTPKFHEDEVPAAPPGSYAGRSAAVAAVQRLHRAVLARPTAAQPTRPPPDIDRNNGPAGGRST